MSRLAMGWTASAWCARWSFGIVLLAGLAATAVPALATTDADGDGYVVPADCDDLDGSVWSLPGELQDLHFTSKTTFVWNAGVDLGGTGVEYVTLRSTSPSDFVTTPPAACPDTGGLTTSTTDTTIPTPGHALFYLVRARNSCGNGSLGAGSSGTPRAGAACDCSALCNDSLACTRDRCADGVCAHDPITTLIQAPPDSVAICPGETAQFRVRGVPDGSTLHYQWKKNGANVGTDSPLLTLSGVALADNGAQITCVVTGACPSSTSVAAVLTVFPTAASCAGGGNGYEALNGASSIFDEGGADVSRINQPVVLDGSQSSDPGSVYLFSGEFHLEEADLVIAGRGYDFVWGREYRSREGALSEMGQNWDHTYDRRVVAGPGGTLSVYVGTNRHDTYTPGPTGCWTSPGYFRDICPQPDGSFVMTFPNHTTWTFAPLDGSPAQGRILSVHDSSGNPMTFSYSASGRLSIIIDTMGRPITVSYNADGFISSVTDFGGHSVTYAYYSVADLDGSPSDLKSVTSPPVTGTPNGNEFPTGKTTTYTYAKSTGQVALDHNLVSVSRTLGLDNNAPPTVILRNVYTTTTSPASPRFDRIDRQVFGDDPSTSVSYVYVQATPGEEPPAVTKTIFRDRVGNVGEAYFDSSNRLVTLKQLTGQAPSHSLPTDPTTNRPVSQFRPATDPPVFRTHVTHNSEGLITEISFPKLDSVAFTYDSGNPDVKLHANLLQRVRLPGPAGGDQSSITESWTYGSFGIEPCACMNCCAAGGDPDDLIIIAGVSVGYTYAKRAAITDNQRKDVAAIKTYVEQAIASGRTGGHGGGGGGGCGGASCGAFYAKRNAITATQQNEAAAMKALVETAVARGGGGGVGQGGGLYNFRASKGGAGQGGAIYNVDTLRGGVGQGGGLYNPGTGASYSRDGDGRGGGIWNRWATYTDPLGHVYTHSIDPATGNVLSATAPPVTTSTGVPQTITESWDYNTYGQLVRHTDPLGHITKVTYESSGPAAGYLDSITVDAPGSMPGSPLALHTVFVRDQYGNPTQITDPRGHTQTLVYNQLDQLVRHIAPAPLSYVTDYRYSAGDHLVQIVGDNRDETGAPRERQHSCVKLAYDHLGRCVQTTLDGPCPLDPAGGLNLTTELVYDDNGQLTLTRSPEAVSGHQPNSVVRVINDEKRMVYRTIAAEGDPASLTTQLDYDLDGNLAAVTRSPGVGPRQTTSLSDGYGRVVQVTDATGNVATSHYDANGNMASSRYDGELTDAAGSGSNVRLAESTMTYDEIDRPVQIDRAFFDTPSGMPIGDGVSTTRIVYDECSQVVHTEDDNGNGSYMAYDGAGRLSSTSDPSGSTVEYQYDENGNVVTVTATEVPDSPGSPPQVHVTTNVYDPLDSLLSTSHAGVTYSFAWDSQRDGPVVTLDGRENETRIDYDPAGRLTATHRKMTDTGTGSGTVVSVLDTSSSYDGNSRLVSQTDDNGNTTIYLHDPMGRIVATTHPDGTSESSVYDVHGDLVSSTDPNGTVTDTAHDTLGRVTSRTITRAPGVLGTTSETWKHDGMSRIVYAQNNDALVTREFDSLSHMTQESTTTGGGPPLIVRWVFGDAGDLSSVTYPSGHNLGMVHDQAHRLKTQTSAGPGVCSGGPPPHAFCSSSAECGGGACVPMPVVTMTYDYLGPDRVVHSTNGNGTETLISYDDLRRPTREILRINPDDTWDDRVFTWDDDSNKTSRTVMTAMGPATSHTYGYDSASRMVQSMESRPGLPSVTIDYPLDGVGNRTTVQGGPDAGSYPMSSVLPQPADRQMNQYTSTPYDAAHTYDLSGSLVSRASGSSTLSYDYRGRLVLVSGSLGTGSYAYDVFGRRVLADGKRFAYDGPMEIEELTPTGALSRDVVPSRVAGGATMAVADFNSDGNPDRVFFHPDDLGNVVVVTEALGNPVELYDYGDFGRPRIFSPGGSSIPQTAIGNVYMFGGHRYDASTGLYKFPTRYLDPRAGRFISRDSIGTWGDPSAPGNGSVYAGNNPWSSTDPTGMAKGERPLFTNGNLPDITDFVDRPLFTNGNLPDITDFVERPLFTNGNLPDITDFVERPLFTNGNLPDITDGAAVKGKIKWFNDAKGFGRMRPPMPMFSWGSSMAAKLCPGNISCPGSPSFSGTATNEVGVEELEIVHEKLIRVK